MRENISEFLYSPVDMPSLDLSVMVHRLNINPKTNRMVQNKRIFAPERQKAIIEEVKKVKGSQVHKKGTIFYLVVQYYFS